MHVLQHKNGVHRVQIYIDRSGWATGTIFHKPWIPSCMWGHVTTLEFTQRYIETLSLCLSSTSRNESPPAFCVKCIVNYGYIYISISFYIHKYLWSHKGRSWGGASIYISFYSQYIITYIYIYIYVSICTSMHNICNIHKSHGCNQWRVRLPFMPRCHSSANHRHPVRGDVDSVDMCQVVKGWSSWGVFFWRQKKSIPKNWMGFLGIVNI